MEILLGILGISGVFASILGLVLAFYAVFVNGKANKEILREIQKGTIEIQASGERQNQILREVQASGERQNQMLKEHSEILKEIQASGERQSQILDRIDARAVEHSQILKEVQASAERIEETQKYVAELVRIEGEKTRSLISH